MNHTRPDRRDRLDRLAAEYVLGTLPVRVRKRLARLARTEPAVAQAIAEWERRLAPLAVALPGVSPPPRVWQRIVERLALADDPSVGTPGRWGQLAFWRALAIIGFAATLALGVALLAPGPGTPESPIVIVLVGQDGKPALIASARRNDPFLSIKTVGAAPVDPGRSLELWMLPAGAPPRSLGVLPAADIARVRLDRPDGWALEGIPALAISLEPAGGSRTGLPTGPVLYSGSVERMY